jgi:hypothetical protein
MKKVFLFLAAFCLTASTALAYDVVDVKNGGSVKGKVKAAAKYDDPMLKIDKDVDFCGKSQKAMMYEISGGMEVKNVLVVIEDVQKGKAAPKKDLIVDNVKCYFAPLMGIAYVGSTYEIKNSDSIFHNTSLALMLKDKRRTVYNLALPRKDQVIKKPVRTPGLHDVKCDAHPWMRSYIYASNHPYVAITDASGNFEIKDLLPGKYKIKFWHEGMGEVIKDVEVSTGKAADMNITMSKK